MAGDRESWISLKVPIVSIIDAQHVSFVAMKNGRHALALDFELPISDARVREVVDTMAATTGMPQAPRFNFSWQVLTDDTVVAEAKAPMPSIGFAQTGADSLGGGALQSVSPTFGFFELRAGTVYLLRMTSGHDFEPILRENPRVIVELWPDLG